MDSNKILTILGAAAIFAACTPDLNLNMAPDKIGFSKTELVNVVSVYEESAAVSIIKSGKGFDGASVELGICSDAEVSAYSPEGEVYSVISPAYYTIDQTSFTFGTNDVRASASVTWNAAELAAKYKNVTNAIPVIPIKIASSSVAVDSSRIVMFIRPYIHSVSFDKTNVRTLAPEQKKDNAKLKIQGTSQIGLDMAIAGQDAKFGIGFDPSLISYYAEKDGIDYKPAPEGLFKLKESSLTIKAGEFFASFSYEADYSVIFNEKGKFTISEGKYIAPIKFTSYDPNTVKDGEFKCTSLVLSVNKSGEVEPPIGVPDKDFVGPWEVIDGQQFDMAHDPANPDHSWYDMYNASKLVDGNFHYYDGAMGNWFWTQNVFPIHYTIDLGQSYIFSGFRLVDSKSHQNQYIHVQVYVATEWCGNDADTPWVLAFEGTRNFTAGWQSYPADDGSKESLDKNFTYHMPEDINADLQHSFVYTRGQIVKLVLVEPYRTEGDYANGRGYLMEFFVRGWED